MSYDITKLTNVTIGGSPDIGSAPTSGLLKIMIDSIISLSDSIVYHETLLEENKVSTQDNLVIQIEDTIINTTKNIKTLTYFLESQMYSDDYHDPQASGQPVPTEIANTIFR